MALAEFCIPAVVIGAIVLVPMTVRVIYQYERGVMFQFGKYIGMREPGLTIVIPILQDIHAFFLHNPMQYYFRWQPQQLIQPFLLN